MTDEDLRVLVTSLTENFTSIVQRQTALAERMDDMIKNSQEIALATADTLKRIEALERKRQTSVLIPLIVGAFAISIGTLALVITILFQLLGHITKDIH